MGDLTAPLHMPGEAQQGNFVKSCPEGCVLAQLLCRGLRELRFPPCPRYSTRVEPVDDVFLARLEIAAREHVGGWSHEAYGSTPDEAKKKVAFAAITALCEELPEEIEHTSLRYIPLADPEDALWLTRLNNMLIDPPDHDALITVIQYASESVGLYR